jgi:hypothetical protein
MTGEVTASGTVSLSVDAKGDTDKTVQTDKPDLLTRFLEERKNDYFAWQLILFFAEHPYVRFNRLAVVHALNPENGRRYVLKALDELIEMGVIKTSTEGNMSLYSLAENTRRLILKLTKPAQT